MKKLFKAVMAAVLSAVTVISAAVPMCAADKTIDTMTPQEIVDDMKIGWNLGNSLDSFGNTYSTPQSAETYWGNPATTKAMIDKVKSAGFNTLRVPVTWHDKCDSSGTIDAAWLARVKEVVDYGIDNDMYVILNIHHEDGGSGRSGWLIPNYENQSACESKIANLWTQIGTYFKDYDRHLIFEAMNEPRMVGTSEEWTGGTAETRAVINALNKKAVAAIRATGGNNGTRLVMCPPCAAKIDAISGFELPEDDNIAVSIHNYSPYEFAMNQYGTADWGTDSDKNALKNEIVKLYNNFTAKGIPVVIGEMGATYKYESDKNRPEWAKYYTSTAKSYGITCVVWDNNSADGDGENFGLLNRGTFTWRFPELVEALVGGVGESVPVQPGDDGSDAYTTVLFEGSASAEEWAQPYKEDMSNMPEIKEGATIAVAYSGDNQPYLVFQNYTTGEWYQMLPDYVSDSIAYYSYNTIVSTCQSSLDTMLQMLVMSNGCYTTVTKITLSYPHLAGDVNSDGYVNAKDAVLILKHLAGIVMLTSAQQTYADLDSDGADMKDVISILRM